MFDYVSDFKAFGYLILKTFDYLIYTMLRIRLLLHIKISVVCLIAIGFELKQ